MNMELCVWYVCVQVCYVCVYVHHMHAWCLGTLEEVIRSPWSGVMDGGETYGWVLGTDASPLREQVL